MCNPAQQWIQMHSLPQKFCFILLIKFISADFLAMILQDIPPAIVGFNIFSQFLVLKDLAVLDASITNKKLRNFLMDCYTFVMISTPTELSSLSKCKWLNERKVQLTNVVCRSGRTVNCSYAFSDVFKQSGFISTIDHYEIDEDDLPCDFFEFLSRECKNLVYLKSESKYIPISSFVIVTQNCLKLDKLKVIRSNVSDHDILTVIRNSSSLVELYLDGGRFKLVYLTMTLSIDLILHQSH